MGNGTFLFHQSRHPKIRQMRLAVLIQQNVSRFNIAMQESVFVRELHGAREVHRIEPTPDLRRVLMHVRVVSLLAGRFFRDTSDKTPGPKKFPFTKYPQSVSISP